MSSLFLCPELYVSHIKHMYLCVYVVNLSKVAFSLICCITYTEFKNVCDSNPHFGIDSPGNAIYTII